MAVCCSSSVCLLRCFTCWLHPSNCSTSPSCPSLSPMASKSPWRPRHSRSNACHHGNINCKSKRGAIIPIKSSQQTVESMTCHRKSNQSVSLISCELVGHPYIEQAYEGNSRVHLCREISINCICTHIYPQDDSSLKASQLIKTHLMCSNLLLQLGGRAPDDVTGHQSFSLFRPAQNERFHTLIFLHLSLCLLTRKRPKPRIHAYILKRQPHTDES